MQMRIFEDAKKAQIINWIASFYFQMFSSELSLKQEKVDSSFTSLRDDNSTNKNTFNFHS